MTIRSANEDWTPCEPGLISGRLRDVGRQRVRRDMVRYGVATAGLAILAAGLVRLFPGGETVLLCSDVKERADDYVAGRLDESWRSRIESHLATCRPCAAMIARMRSQQTGAESAPRL